MNPEDFYKLLNDTKGVSLTEYSYSYYDKQHTQVDLKAYLSDTEEQINELSELKTNNMNDKLNSINAFSTAIRNKNYIVGSVNAAGTLSFADNPTEQLSRSSARAECTRLAKIYPGKMYIFVELVGAEMLPVQVATISI